MAEDDRIIIKPLGAGNEVGRSCIHVKYKEKELLLDCGVHPAYSGISALPFLDLVDLSKIKAVLITHFHLDHAAALPFLTEKTAFKGKVYMTHPTKAILKWLLNDYIRVINSSSEQDFYTEKDLDNCYSKIIPIDYHQQVVVDGIRFTALNAGHALGAAMFLLEIENSTLLYTGDYSREEDRHLKAAESPGRKLDALITESTYGVQCHLPRAEREHRFTSVVTDVVLRGGRCLLPVFALGRAQELLLILEEHWHANPNLKSVPIYYVSALARRCMTVYQTYVNMMNERIQRISLKRNPFEFSYVQSLRDMQAFKDDQPCVMMASPGMLQSGVSRELFERWCSDPRNGVVIPGYCVAGTLAKDILSEPKEVESMRGGMLKLNMTVEYISFSAHADYTQNSQFIDECAPKNLFFVHGEVNEMMRLKNMIGMRNEKNGVEMNLFALKNGEEGSFPVNKKNEAMVYTDKARFKSLVVSDGGVRIFDSDDLSQCEFKKLKFKQKQRIPFNSTFSLLRQILVAEYDAVEAEDQVNGSESNPSDGVSPSHKCFTVGGILIRCCGEAVVMEWEGSYVNDVIAMAIKKSIGEIGQTVKSVRLSRATQMETLCETLKGYYRDVHFENGRIMVRLHDKLAFVEDMVVSGSDSEFVERISAIVQKVNVLYK
ncbi:cleavage and polyadenylation specificity factor subunit 3 [Pancytospora epiphaga]|nr:cleavage and polyadenylation specificity factor subunit 3 [Pancytospora epiphaga]